MKQTIGKIMLWVYTIVFLIFCLFYFCGCDSLSREPRQFLKFDSFAPTSIMQVKCAGKSYRAKGVFWCEEKSHNKSELNIKVMPFIGTLTESNGLRTKSNDFNWAEKKIFIWKKKIISDTFLDIETTDLLGINPLVFSVIARHDSGVISNRGIFINSSCDDINTPCTHLKVEFNCNGEMISSSDFKPIVCAQGKQDTLRFKITHNINEGSKIIAINLANNETLKITEQEFEIKAESGPNIIAIRVLNNISGKFYLLQSHALIVHHEAGWTGIDKPHYIFETEKDKNGFTKNYITWYKPFQSDILEVITDKKREVSKESVRVQVNESSCAFAYSRSANDITETCTTDKGKEKLHSYSTRRD